MSHKLFQQENTIRTQDIDISVETKKRESLEWESLGSDQISVLVDLIALVFLFNAVLAQICWSLFFFFFQCVFLDDPGW